jgi:isopentenyl phosphate kinase
LKLGGSIITNKSRPELLNREALDLVVSAIHSATKLSRASLKLILVHGGGSFGHYYAKKFHISRQSTKISPLGIALTTQSMLKLHSYVREAFLKRNLGIETILPSELLSENQSLLSSEGISRLRSALECELSPITFGYVLLSHGEAFIISGDQICKAIANSFTIQRMIFVMNVDGIYPDPTLRGRIVRRLSSSAKVSTSNANYDVTGGVGSKLDLGFEILRTGAQVFYVNGYNPSRLRNLLLGREEEKATQLVD